MKNALIFAVLTLTLTLAASLFAACNMLKDTAIESHTVIYMDGESTLFTETVEHNAHAVCHIPEREGYDFDYWTLNGQEYNFNRIVKCDLTLYAAWAPEKYMITFIADGVTVQQTEYSVGMVVEEPAVPMKIGYIGYWQPYELNGGDKSVYAVYRPITYRAVFLYEDEVYADYTFDCGQEFCYPDMPEREGYYFLWEGPDFDGYTYTFRLIRKKSIYIATFVADGVVVDRIEFTVDTTEITPPAVPEKEGYAGIWEEFELRLENITVTAIYWPNAQCSESPSNEVDHNCKEPDNSEPDNSEPEDDEPEPVIEEEYTQGLLFYRTDDGYVVGGYAGTDTDVIIPSVYDGLHVIAIGESAFNLNGSITSVVIPSSVKRIEEKAFRFCTALKRVEIAEGLEYIGKSAFGYCEALKEIYLPKSLQKAENNAFSNCNVTVYITADAEFSPSSGVTVKYYD